MKIHRATYSGLPKMYQSKSQSLTLGLKATILLVLLNLGFSQKLFADDPGIAKVRLIQQSDTTYIFEVDIPQAFLGSFKEPILPPGFSISTPQREFQSGWVTLKATINSNNSGFQPDHIIVLPWARNAVDITAQWLDGKTYKGFFNRTMNGIQVPLNQIMSVQLSTKEVLKAHFKSAIDHWRFKLVHFLLILALTLAVPGRKAFSFLLVFTLGQMTALVLTDLHFPTYDLLFADLILLLLVIYISYYLVKGTMPKYLSTLLFFTALLHSLSFGHELHAENLLKVQRVQALFAFNMGIDLVNYSVCTLLLIGASALKKIQLKTALLPILTGSLAVFSILFILSDNLLANRKQILDFQQPGQEVLVQANINSPAGASGVVAKSKGFMTTPIMVFLSVEPYETRKEILLTGNEVRRILNLGDVTSESFPVVMQDQIKRDLENLISNTDTTFINSIQTDAVKVTANFVTLGKGGVSIKETAVEESIDEAIVGISVNYITEDFPDSIQFNWHVFPEYGNIDLSLVDPHATFAGELDPNNNAVNWESRIKGFRLPAIEPIEVKDDPVPIVSYVLWLVLGIVFLWLRYSQKNALYNSWIKTGIISLLIVGFMLFPFVRPALGISALSHSKPSAEKGTILLNDLLGNVYRAFDRKQEDLVYDLLALSVSNEQLTEIYLQNRQSMALENRGGARATVDEVKISELFSIEKTESSAYRADVEWTVRGSVNHFGHTHYRQNQYRALVSFVIENEHWKINDIEILDARRLY